MDIKNTFLYGDLTKQVLLGQPLGYVAQGENRMYMLKKAICKLKQSPRAWFEKFSRVVTDSFTDVLWTIQSSTGRQVVVVWFLRFMLMTFY